MSMLQIHGKQVTCRGILFDKDGTLLDFLQLWGPWAESLLNQLESQLSELGASFTVEREQVLGTVRNREGQLIGYDLQGPLAIATVDESNGLLAGQLYAAGMPWNEAITTIRHFSSVAMDEVRQRKMAEPLPGLNAFLQSCQEASIPMAVVTSDSTAAAEEHLEWMGIRSYFTSIVGSDRVTRGKPDGEAAVLACRELHILPEEAVVIGDSNGDMQMGRNAGVSCRIGFCPEVEGSHYLYDADVIIQNYDELKIISERSSQG
ncbi:HAD family hydrolase [Paenibacillus taichungensis]|uniref:HAD family hydrolase n=1 Tax=Paenibacillus taichungensis TaxID=484184 RepID=A0ABX2MUN7_9BACL|nr:HAD family hydrolase [Paenibacillus taichungensis]MDR9747612.1 HAD family hydrolase [Paenibacillus taichungensis]NUU57798.1 HAD family hydrolase [Paenibacillus taichungensis]